MVAEERGQHRLEVVALPLLELGGKVVRPQPEDVAREDKLVLEEVVEAAAQMLRYLLHERIEEALHHALARFGMERVVRARNLALDDLPVNVRKLGRVHFRRADLELAPEVLRIREVERVVGKRNAHAALSAFLRGEREEVPPFVGEERRGGVLRRPRPRTVVRVVHLHAGDAGLVDFLDLLEHALLVERIASAPPPERHLAVAGRRRLEVRADRLRRLRARLRETDSLGGQRTARDRECGERDGEGVHRKSRGVHVSSFLH